jgi:hypothetical protein
MRADADSRLTAAGRSQRGHVMPNSQITMVVRGDGGVGWNVCGGFKVPTEQLDPKIYVGVVVRQGDVVAHGGALVPSRKWRLAVKPERGEFTVGRPAIVSAVAIAQQDPSGLEAFTWAQRVEVLQRRTDGNPDPVFADPDTVSGQGELAAGRVIASSLTLKEAGAAAGDGSLSWEHKLQTS